VGLAVGIFRRIQVRKRKKISGRTEPNSPLPLQHAGHQAAVEENLGKRHVDRENVVAELAGVLAAAGEGTEVVEQDDVLTALAFFQHLVVSHAIDAAIDGHERRDKR
jgi:hypothetical protein